MQPNNNADVRDVVVTGAQLRAARGLLNMSVSDLAERTGLALNTVRKAESTNAAAPVTAANAKLLTSTLEAAGVMFIPAGTHGAGVQLRSPDQEPLKRRRVAK
jgi:transcriptional regulator with XRE-family HTH domain